jgi:hypothetical protein
VSNFVALPDRFSPRTDRTALKSRQILARGTPLRDPLVCLVSPVFRVARCGGMESTNAASSPSFPVLDPIVVDDGMENTYRDTDMEFLDPSRLSMSSADAGRDFDDLFAHAATSRSAPASESSHLSPSELSGKHQYKEHDKLKQPHMLASGSPAESPDNSSRSSSSESPRNHFRNPSVTSSSSTAHSENTAAPFRFSSEDWMNPELESVKEEPLFRLDNAMPADGGLAMGPDLESSNKAMDAAFDFESAASSPSYLNSDATPQAKYKARVKSKLRSSPNSTRRSMDKVSATLPPSSCISNIP